MALTAKWPCAESAPGDRVVVLAHPFARDQLGDAHGQLARGLLASVHAQAPVDEPPRKRPRRPAPVAADRPAGVTGPEAGFLRARARDRPRQPEACGIQELLVDEPRRDVRRQPRERQRGESRPGGHRQAGAVGPLGKEHAPALVPQACLECRHDPLGALAGLRVTQARQAVPRQRPGGIDQDVDRREGALRTGPPVGEAAPAIGMDERHEAGIRVRAPPQHAVVGRRGVQSGLVGLQDADEPVVLGARPVEPVEVASHDPQAVGTEVRGIRRALRDVCPRGTQQRWLDRRRGAVIAPVDVVAGQPREAHAAGPEDVWPRCPEGSIAAASVRSSARARAASRWLQASAIRHESQ